MDLHNKRYKTLAEHRAAVKRRKDKERLTGGQDISTLKSKPSNTKAVRSTSTSTNSAATSKPKTKTKPKPKPKADGSVKAIPRKTKYTKDVEARNKAEKTKRKSNFDGVGPSDSKRRKQSSASAMAKKPKEGSYKTVNKQRYIYKAGKWRKISKYSMDQKG